MPSICKRLGALPRHCGEQLIAALNRHMARVHEHEAACAIGVLGHAWRKTSLSKGSGLLIAGQACNGHRQTQKMRISFGQHAAAWHHLRQD